MNNTTITKNDCNKVMNKIIDLSLKFLNLLKLKTL